MPGFDHLIDAGVSEELFKRYAHRERLCLVFAPDDPLTFLIQGE